MKTDKLGELLLLDNWALFMFRKEFVDFIVNTGMLTYKDLKRLVEDKDKEAITEFDLLKFKNFDDIKFAKQIAQKCSMPYIELSKAKISDDTLSLLSRSIVRRYRVLPIQQTAKTTTVAIYDPSVVTFLEILVARFKRPVEMIVTNLKSWKTLYSRVKLSVDEMAETVFEVKGVKVEEKEISADDIGEDIIFYVNRILADAFHRGASDIHLEPYEKSFRVRFRIDGELIEIIRPPQNLVLPIISRIKILASLNISEKRKPQDGRIKLEMGGRPIDYRVSCLPTLFGEKIVLRLLDQSNLQLDMTMLGFEKKQLDTFLAGIHRPYGMCLVTGPTGSGKTTTLYSALADLNSPSVNIATAEDPCEFNLEGINQVNVRKEIDLTFASALKAFLRQDPDIIMVGEIRDAETGEIAVEASLTGHMVLSTLHTNDAPSTIVRMINMGMEPFLITSAVNVIVAQRLCRKICSNCKEVHPASLDELIACGIAPASAEKIKVYKGKGCEMCNGSGYKGRLAIYEVMTITPLVRQLILNGGTKDEIKRTAIKEGMKTLRMSALTKVVQGATTLNEAITNSSADDL